MKLDLRTVILGGALVAANTFSLLRWPPGPERAAALGTPAVTVQMTETNRFNPATIHVPAGQAVVWENGSSIVHTVTGEDFDSGLIAAGGKWQHIFTTPGTYEYHCIPHQQMGMVGTVVVDP